MIQGFPRGKGANSKLIVSQNFIENCLKIKKIGRGPNLDPQFRSSKYQGGSRISCRRGRQHTNLPDFPTKMHEIKKILVRWGGSGGGAPLGSTTEYICLTSLTHAKCGTRSTLCWKVGNISGSTELFAL